MRLRPSAGPLAALALTCCASAPPSATPRAASLAGESATPSQTPSRERRCLTIRDAELGCEAEGCGSLHEAAADCGRSTVRPPADPTAENSTTTIIARFRGSARKALFGGVPHNLVQDLDFRLQPARPGGLEPLLHCLAGLFERFSPCRTLPEGEESSVLLLVVRR